MLTDLTKILQAGKDLGPQEITLACGHLLDEAGPTAGKVDFLRALRNKGETPAEISAFVAVLLERAVRPLVPDRGLLDVCGTGGDKTGFFNISTAAMFVTAACGAPVVKQGNRGVTSKSGGADVLEALGVKIDLPPEQAGEALDKAGCCFLFARLYHPTFQAVAPARKVLGEEGVSTIFNLLGPLLNPARPDFQIVGVFDPKWLPAYAETLRLLGRRRAWAVNGHGPDGMRIDEVSSLGPTEICAVENGAVRRFVLDAADHGIPPANPSALSGGDSVHNAKMIVDILRGADPGPRSDMVLVNAACALVVAGRVSDFPAGLAAARQALADGAAFHRLELLRSVR